MCDYATVFYNQCSITRDRVFCDISVLGDLIASSYSAFGGNLISLDLATFCDQEISLVVIIRKILLCVVGQSSDVLKVVVFTSIFSCFYWLSSDLYEIERFM